MCFNYIPRGRPLSLKVWNYIRKFDKSTCYKGKIFATDEGLELCEACSRQYKNLEIFHIHVEQKYMKNKCDKCGTKICTENRIMECKKCSYEVAYWTVLLREEKYKIKLLRQERHQREIATDSESSDSEPDE